MTNDAHVQSLMDTVKRGYRREEELYAQEERYTSAGNKSMRDDISRKRSALRSEIERAEQELLSAGYYTEVSSRGVNFPKK